MLKTGNKSIDKIFAIIQLEEVKFKSKRAIKNINNAAISIQNKISNSSFQKKKINSNKKCYNYYQKRHFS